MVKKLPFFYIFSRLFWYFFFEWMLRGKWNFERKKKLKNIQEHLLILKKKNEKKNPITKKKWNLIEETWKISKILYFCYPFFFVKIANLAVKSVRVLLGHPLQRCKMSHAHRKSEQNFFFTSFSSPHAFKKLITFQKFNFTKYARFFKNTFDNLWNLQNWYPKMITLDVGLVAGLLVNLPFRYKMEVWKN